MALIESVAGELYSNGNKVATEWQTWQEVTTNREIDVEYTNDTGKSIMISVIVEPTASGLCGISLEIDGLNFIGFAESESWAYINGLIIPSGSTYTVKSRFTNEDLFSWMELR